MKRWAKDEIDFMRAALEEDWVHKEIGLELGRTAAAITRKAGKLGIVSTYNTKKTTEDYRKELPKDIILLEAYQGDKSKILHKHSCSNEWLVRPHDILKGSGCPKCSSKARKTTEIYKTELPKDIIVLKDYITRKTKILHKHIKCDHAWLATPESILRGYGCPICSISGFKEDQPAIAYCIYFEEYDLYKVGISNKYKRRLKEFGSTPEVIFIREFELGSDAKLLENQWLDNIKDYKINTGLLKSGNTETFKIEEVFNGD